MPSVVDFDDAPAGVCLIWHLSYEDGLTGLEAGMNTSDLQGCFSLSNAIEVIRNQPVGGTLSGGPFTFCVGDGVADNIPAGSITLSGNEGGNSQWIVTDDQGNILGLPPMPSVVDFDDAPAGVCLIWHLSYEDGLTGLEAGMNTSDLQGCFSLSNAIEVIRQDCNLMGGIVLNEIDGADLVEISNTSTSTVDISTYWLCNFPAYDQLQNLTINCGGDLILAPGELVVVETSFDIDEADGEMGLYTSNSFGSASDIIDYVEWGSSGHTRSSVAVAAGIWSSGDFVSAFANGTVIEFDGMGDSSSDWSEDAPTPCMTNLTEEDEELTSFQFNLFPNPAIQRLYITNEDSRPFGDLQIVNSLGQVVQTISKFNGEHDDIELDVNHLVNGRYYLRIIAGSKNETKQFVKIN